MQHLLSHSVYQDLSLFGPEPLVSLGHMRCDGLETLTGFFEPDPMYRGITRTVHLPYAPDWLASWEDRPWDMDESYSLFYMYGRGREELVSNIRDAIGFAAMLEPAHGVFHACNADLTEVYRHRYTRDDSYVVDALCEMMNEVVSAMPGGEPPFKIAFENLWWPGLRMLDDSGFRTLERRLEFDNWGFCLDTGHMMSCLPTSSEQDGIERLLRVFEGYPEDMLDRISAVHFHWSATVDYRTTFPEREMGPGTSVQEFIRDANTHVGSLDRHLPFSDPRCVELIEVLDPEFVIHEMLGSERGVIEDYAKQRSHFQ